jgi:hypothetical protein
VLYNNKTGGVSTAILSLYTRNGICLAFVGHIQVRKVHLADFAIKRIDRLVHEPPYKKRESILRYAPVGRQMRSNSVKLMEKSKQLRIIVPLPKPLPRKEGGASRRAFPLPLFTGGRGQGLGG